MSVPFLAATTGASSNPGDMHPPLGSEGSATEADAETQAVPTARARVQAAREVVKIMVPFWVLSRIRHLLFRGLKRGP